MKNSAAQWVTNPIEVANCLVNYYQTLFTSSSTCQLKESISTIPSIITLEMNAQLTSNFMLWEEQAALKQMTHLKAPGPDGIPPLFNQNYWNLVGTDISQSVFVFP